MSTASVGQKHVSKANSVKQASTSKLTVVREALSADRSPEQDTLESYIAYADGLFGSGTDFAFGFIDSYHNVDPKTYGWKSLYTPISKINPYRNQNILDAIKHSSSRESRIFAYDVGLIDERDVLAAFFDLSFRQNSEITFRDKKTNKVITVQPYGRWSKTKPWGYQVQKRLHGNLETIDNPILLSLTVHQPIIESIMPKNTNMDAVVYSILHIGGWVRDFLVKLRHYQEKRNIDWRYIGNVLEFQGNGFPHVHIILAGNWLGNIKEIAALWKYSEPQGVDYMNRAKLKKKWGKEPSSVRVANYLTAYVSRASAAVVFPGDKIDKKGKIWTGEPSIHRGYAYLSYFGGRIFNLAHKKPALTKQPGEAVE